MRGLRRPGMLHTATRLPSRIVSAVKSFTPSLGTTIRSHSVTKPQPGGLWPARAYTEQVERMHGNRTDMAKGAEKRQRDQAGDAPAPQQSKKAKKAAFKQSPEYVARQQIYMAVKRNDQAAALKLYEQIRGHPMDAGLYNTLIHMASGQWDWEMLARKAYAADAATSATSVAGVAGAAAAPLLCHLPQHAYENVAGAGEEGASSGRHAAPPAAAAVASPAGAVAAPKANGSTAGGGAAPADASPPHAAPEEVGDPPSREQLLGMAERLFEEMQAAGHKPDERTYTHMARVACMRQQPERALECARTAVTLGLAKGLRLWQPALVAAALRGDTALADDADAMIAAAGLDLSEGELALLLECAAHARDQARLEGVLRRMSDNLSGLSDSTVELARRHFSAQLPVSAQPQSPPPSWSVSRVQVDAHGFCREAGEKLRLLDLEDSEWGAFEGAVAGLATKSENRPAFGAFRDWLRRHGPFNVLIDGANVALWGQNFEDGRFSLGQVMQVWEQVHQNVPGARPLLVLHTRRQEDIAGSAPRERKWVEQLKQQRQIFFVPRGSNDDWYWLYASVAARKQGLLISNDEMRDHIWSLLRPKHFLKWKERHVARYSFHGGRGAIIQYPSPFSFCVQKLPEGSWMLPAAGAGDWLLALPAGSRAGAALAQSDGAAQPPGS